MTTPGQAPDGVPRQGILPVASASRAVGDRGPSHADPERPRRKVFGVGWAKTGTKTLGGCLRLLGYDHQSQNLALLPQIMQGDYAKLLRVAAAKESFEDWPWLLLFRQLDQAFPGSRFVLTTRAPGRWLTSYRCMLAAAGEPSPFLAQVRQYLYGFDCSRATDDQLLARFTRHNLEVITYFRNRGDDLLVVDWERGDGWSQLCAFLQLPIPAAPFPHLNRRP